MRKELSDQLVRSQQVSLVGNKLFMERLQGVEKLQKIKEAIEVDSTYLSNPKNPKSQSNQQIGFSEETLKYIKIRKVNFSKCKDTEARLKFRGVQACREQQ